MGFLEVWVIISVRVFLSLVCLFYLLGLWGLLFCRFLFHIWSRHCSLRLSIFRLIYSSKRSDIFDCFPIASAPLPTFPLLAWPNNQCHYCLGERSECEEVGSKR